MYNQVDYYKKQLKTKGNYYIQTIPNTNSELTLDKDAVAEYPELSGFNKLLALIKNTTPEYKIIMDDSLSIKYIINPEAMQLKENEISNIDELIINRIQDRTIDKENLEYKLSRLIKDKIIIDDVYYFAMKIKSEQSIKDEFKSFYGKKYEILKDFRKETQNYNVLINTETLQIETVYNTLFAEYDKNNNKLKIKTDTQALADYKKPAEKQPQNEYHNLGSLREEMLKELERLKKIMKGTDNTN